MTNDRTTLQGNLRCLARYMLTKDPKATIALHALEAADRLDEYESRPSSDVITPEALDELRSLSSQLGQGLAENENDPLKLIARVKDGVELIQRVEAQRTADLIEELSKTPKTTWGQVKTAVLERAGITAMRNAQPQPGSGE